MKWVLGNFTPEVMGLIGEAHLVLRLRMCGAVLPVTHTSLCKILSQVQEQIKGTFNIKQATPIVAFLKPCG
jgi:hypothetical protein